MSVYFQLFLMKPKAFMVIFNYFLRSEYTFDTLRDSIYDVYYYYIFKLLFEEYARGKIQSTRL